MKKLIFSIGLILGIKTEKQPLRQIILADGRKVLTSIPQQKPILSRSIIPVEQPTYNQWHEFIRSRKDEEIEIIVKHYLNA